jgi:hypothetical protein
MLSLADTVCSELEHRSEWHNERVVRNRDAVARFDGDALVVESVNILPMMVREVETNAGARTIERYEPSADGSRLQVELTIIDPETFLATDTQQHPGAKDAVAPLVEHDLVASRVHRDALPCELWQRDGLCTQCGKQQLAGTIHPWAGQALDGVGRSSTEAAIA